jgi:AcrR family transcriptional regulator
VVRWEPDSRGRLAEAALALYGERGFENTTVAEIAERAGLTERTFFRHFADKREVLFGGGEEFEDVLVGTVARSPESFAPIDAVAAGLQAVAVFLEERRAFARRRQAIIAASAELRERELIKLASLSSALARTLRARGLPDSAATLAGEIAIAVFRTAYERWLDESNERPLPELMHESLAQLEGVVARA